MTVDELVSGWTDQEKKDLKDLIEECRLREKQIQENSKASRESLRCITDGLKNLANDMMNLKRLADEIVGDLVDYYYRDQYIWRC